jgi:hypothetical protein
MSTHDRDQWLDTTAGWMFTALNGGRDQAKAVLAAVAQAEAKAVREAIEDYEVRYNRRPAASELRYHPAVRQDVQASFNGSTRELAAALRWADPARPVLVSDEQADATITHVVWAPGR